MTILYFTKQKVSFISVCTPIVNNKVVKCVRIDVETSEGLNVNFRSGNLLSLPTVPCYGIMRLWASSGITKYIDDLMCVLFSRKMFAKHRHIRPIFSFKFYCNSIIQNVLFKDCLIGNIVYSTKKIPHN